MVYCQQKYCKHCVKPVLSKSGEFLFGRCNNTNLILQSDADEYKEFTYAQPLYCNNYEKRQRKIKY